MKRDKSPYLKIYQACWKEGRITSLTATGGIEWSRGSGREDGMGELCNRDLMVSLSFWVLEVKNVEKLEQSFFSAASVYWWLLSEEWIIFEIADHRFLTSEHLFIAFLMWSRRDELMSLFAERHIWRYATRSDSTLLDFQIFCNDDEYVYTITHASL